MHIEGSRVSVSCPAGLIVGEVANAAAVFRGIPYAEAPVGDRRFAAPVRRAPLERFEAKRPELPLVWSNFGQRGVSEVLGPIAPSDLLSRMHGAWLEFIRTGRAPWPATSERGMTGAHVFAIEDSFDDERYLVEAELAGLAAEGIG